MNILILSYACRPSAGSEYEVGWKVPTVMARLHPDMNVYVVTRGTSMTQEQMDAVAKFPNLQYLHYDVPTWMKYPHEMRSKWGEQINYLVWQLMVRGNVKHWCKEYKIDIVHHLTFNQYRTPSVGYWLDVPFLIGPVGGAECIAKAFYQDLERHTLLKEKIRVKGHDRKIFKWFLSRKKTKKIVLCSSGENVERLMPYRGSAEMKLVPAIAISPDEFEDFARNASNSTPSEQYNSEHPFEMICASKAWDWKGLRFVLKAISKAFAGTDAHYVFKIVGVRFTKEKSLVMDWVKEYGLDGHVEVVPFIKREDLLKLEANSNLALYPAFRDSGSMSVLEACALACPSICFDAGGQDIFPDEIVMKVSVQDSYEHTISAFADKLQWAYNNRKKLDSIGINAQQWAYENMNWEKKVETFVSIYNEMKVC